MSATQANACEFQDGGKPVASPVYQVDVNGNPITASTSSGSSYATIAAGATGPTVIKATSGILFGVVATTSAAGAPLAYDNASAASGNVLAAIAANAAVGTGATLPGGGVKFTNGLTFAGGATMPGLTVFYS